MGTKLLYSLLVALILGGCGAIPDQGGNSRDSGIYSSTGQPSPDSAPIVIPITGNLNPQESDGDSALAESPPPAPEIEVSAPAIEGVSPSADIPAVEGNTDILPPSSPAFNQDPIVVCAPDTLCYHEEEVEYDTSCRYDDHIGEEVSIVLSKIQPSSEIPLLALLIGKLVTIDKNDFKRHCAVEIKQASGWQASVVTNSSGVFGRFVRDFKTTTRVVDGKTIVVAEFTLQVYSLDELHLPLGDAISIEFEVPHVETEVIRIEREEPIPIEVLHTPIENSAQPYSGIHQAPGGANKPDVPDTNAPSIPLNTNNQPPPRRTDPQNPLGLPRR